MFQSLKRLFRKEEKPAAPAARPAQPFANPAAAPQTTPAAAPAPQPTAAAPAAPQPVTAPLDGPTLSIPFGKILNHLPQSLKARVHQAHTSKTQANLPLALLVPQLMKGRVEVTFAQLRQALPPGSLSEETDLDGSKFEIPLAELLPLIPPHLLPRRTTQKTIEIPDEVAPVFGQAGSEIRVAQKSTPVTPTPAAPPPPPPAPPAAPIPAQTQLPAAPVKAPYRETPAPTPPPAGTPTPSDAGPIRMNAGDLEKLSQPKPAAPAAPVSPAIKPVSPPQAESPLPGTKLPGATARPTIPAPTSTLPTATQATTTTPSSPGTVAVPVNQVIDSLPDAIKGSLIQAKAQNASFHLPAADLEKSLKSGKVVFSWKTLRTSLQPATMSSTTPAADQIEVTLPLHIVAPLFLATHKPAAPQKKVAVAQDIPDVFANRQVATETPAAPETPAPPAPAPQAPIPTSTPAQAPQHSIPIPVPAIPPPKPVQAPATQTIGEIFGQTGRTSWTPAEIAQNTTTLPGVSGAIVALPDGLLVAAKLAPGLDPDTIAAFLPQMYGRTSQYTKELRLGDPKKITFIVDDMPLLIYRGSGVFFGVFGQNGETLPNPQLDVIAAQLGA